MPTFLLHYHFYYYFHTFPNIHERGGASFYMCNSFLKQIFHIVYKTQKSEGMGLFFVLDFQALNPLNRLLYNATFHLKITFV